MNIVLEPSHRFDERAKMRAAHAQWLLKSIPDRLAIVRALRHLIAENADTLAAATTAVNNRPLAEKLASEVLPLADACRWLERNAARVLAPRREGKRGRPLWLRSFTFEVQRQPFGVVLVIGPGNYPLFLPAIHSLHALVAGNAVLLKPAPGAREVALAFARLATEAGLDPALLEVLPDAAAAAHDAISTGVDKVIFTGSSENGRDVLALLADSNTPSVMELSGEDAVIVLADADLDLVARALRFGARLNAGETCIAPRRLIIDESVTDQLLALPDLPALAPERVRNSAEAVACVNTGSHGLGASIFSRDIDAARQLAAQIKTGFVLINDLVVPTADPRLPFGGVKASGFGTTRGAEGLLEMTFPHVIGFRRERRHPHFDESTPGDAHLFTTYIRAAHGTHRFAAWREFLGAIIHRTGKKKS